MGQKFGRAQLHMAVVRFTHSAAFSWGLGWMRQPEKTPTAFWDS